MLTKTQLQMIHVAKRQLGLDDADYREVLRRLKKDAIANDALMPTYRTRLKDIEAIVRREKIVTMPEREAVIRVATEAESTAIPAPHLSPPLAGSSGCLAIGCTTARLPALHPSGMRPSCRMPGPCRARREAGLSGVRRS